MRRALACLCISLAFTASVRARAKPGGVSACEANLAVTRAAIEAQSLLWINAHHGLLSLILFQPADEGQRAARTRKVRLIREALEARSTSVAIFAPTDARPADCDKVARDVDAFKQKRLVERFETAPVVIIDSLEDFMFAFDEVGKEANLALLRQILRERVRNRRPTILTLDDVTNADRHLRDLTH